MNNGGGVSGVSGSGGGSGAGENGGVWGGFIVYAGGSVRSVATSVVVHIVSFLF